MALVLEWKRPGVPSGRAYERAVARAVKKAGGDAIRAVRAASNRQIRERKRMRAGAVSKGLRLHFPRGSKLHELAWTLEASGRAVPLGAYPARQVRRGVSVAVNRGKRTIVKSAFLATMRSGHRGVFVRKGDKRLPIKELFSSTIADVMRDAGRADQLEARGANVFRSAFDRLLPLELARVKGGAGE